MDRDRHGPMRLADVVTWKKVGCSTQRREPSGLRAARGAHGEGNGGCGRGALLRVRDRGDARRLPQDRMYYWNGAVRHACPWPSLALQPLAVPPSEHR